MSTPLHVVCPQCNGVNRLPAEKLADGGRCGKCKAPLFDGQPVELNQSNFATQIQRSDIPVLVDFWAPWCGPCKMMAPVFVQAAAQLQPRVRLAKVNTETEQGLGAQYNIRSIPTLVLFKQGREVDRIAGALDLQNLIAWTQQHL